MNYREYKLKDFLNDQFFIGWVRNPTPESDYFWKNWMRQNPDNRKIAEQAAAMIRSLKYSRELPTDEETTETLENILVDIHHYESGKRERRGWNMLPLRIAASLTLLISVTYGIYRLNAQSGQPATMERTEIVKTTEKGQKLFFKLQDGSRVHLNANSELIIASDFGQGSRTISLKGEAYFEVARDTTRPFIIKTHDLTTTVLGTSFNIESYPDDSQTRVAVSSGLVRIDLKAQAPSAVNTVAANEMLTFHHEMNEISIGSFLPEEAMGWKDHILYLKKADFDEIKKSIENWYGVTFHIHDQPHREAFTGIFKRESLEEVLDALNYTSDNVYTLNGNIVNVESKKLTKSNDYEKL